jgi:hypothetical protein
VGYSNVRGRLTLIIVVATLAAYGSPSKRAEALTAPQPVAFSIKLDINKQLVDAILYHVRQRLPGSEASTVEAEAPRVRAFVHSVESQVLHPPPWDQLEAAAFAEIDSAGKRPATASELVRAAMVGMLNSIGRGAKMLPTSAGSMPNVRHTSFRDVGNIRIVTPDLDLHKMSDLDCSEFNEPFDLSHLNASGVILDLRGNQGASLDIAVCVANHLVRSGVPIFTFETVLGRDTRDSHAIPPRPLNVPLVIFLDKDTNEGALGLAAALQDQRHAKIIGEQRQPIDDNVLNLIVRAGDSYMLPIAEMMHADGRALATAGVQIDVAVPPSDDNAMIAAARKEISHLKPEAPLP